MKIKLVKFKDIDMDGATEIDYGLSIGNVYEVADRYIELKSFDIINSDGKPVKVFEDDEEVQL